VKPLSETFGLSIFAAPFAAIYVVGKLFVAAHDQKATFTITVRVYPPPIRKLTIGSTVVGASATLIVLNGHAPFLQQTFRFARALVISRFTFSLIQIGPRSMISASVCIFLPVAENKLWDLH